jgi:hypothetical protein
MHIQWGHGTPYDMTHKDWPMNVLVHVFIFLDLELLVNLWLCEMFASCLGRRKGRKSKAPAQEKDSMVE